MGRYGMPYGAASRVRCFARSLIVMVWMLAHAAALAGAAREVQRGDTSARRVPVLAELFTSEGCSSCPPADDLLRRLVDEQPVEGVEVIALSEHVDYWDHQGWKDPFSSHDFTRRQNAYAKVFRTNRIYTPQLVVDGRLEAVGSDWTAVRRALLEAARQPRAAVTLSVRLEQPGKAVSVRVSVRDLIASATASTLQVVAAIVEDDLTTSVLRGENASRRLRHSAVTRSLKTIGAIDRGETSRELSDTLDLHASWRVQRLRVVVFLQDEHTRQVVGATSSRIE